MDIQDTGLHTALIARWPRRVEPGRRTNALVQYADVLPTLMDLAGGSLKGSRIEFCRRFEGESQCTDPMFMGCITTFRRARLIQPGQFRMVLIAWFSTSLQMKCSLRNT